MNSIEITYKNKAFTIEVPSGWNECDRKMYFKVCDLLRENDLSQERLRIFLHRTCKLPRRVIRAITDVEIHAIMSTFDWVLEPPTHIQSSVGWWFIFRGPQHALSNVIAKQYGLADEAFIKYCEAVEKGDKQEALKFFNKLCAALLTPFGLGYRDWIATAQLKFMRFLPASFKQVVLYQFWGIRNEYVKQFPLTHTRRKTKGKNYGWIGLFVDMAGEKFGPVSNVKKENFYEIMIQCEKNFEHLKEAEKQRKK